MLHLSFHLILRRLPTTPIGLDRSEIRCAEFIQARLESVVVRLARVSGGEELPTLRLESVGRLVMVRRTPHERLELTEDALLLALGFGLLLRPIGTHAEPPSCAAK